MSKGCKTFGLSVLICLSFQIASAQTSSLKNTEKIFIENIEASRDSEDINNDSYRRKMFSRCRLNDDQLYNTANIFKQNLTDFLTKQGFIIVNNYKNADGILSGEITIREGCADNASILLNHSDAVIQGVNFSGKILNRNGEKIWKSPFLQGGFSGFSFKKKAIERNAKEIAKNIKKEKDKAK